MHHGIGHMVGYTPLPLTLSRHGTSDTWDSDIAWSSLETVQTCSLGDKPAPTLALTPRGSQRSTYSQQASSMHPTGMLSCFEICSTSCSVYQLTVNRWFCLLHIHYKIIFHNQLSPSHIECEHQWFSFNIRVVIKFVLTNWTNLANKMQRDWVEHH